MKSTTRASINVALKIIGVAGLTTLVVAAPNAVQALDKLMKKSGAKGHDPQKLLNELKRQGLVLVTQVGDEINFNLNPAGAYRLQRVAIDELEITPPKKWDKKWRLVSFDVPVNKSRDRKYFVEKLQELGFMLLHKSLWVYPFPCFEQVEQLAGHYNILRHCRFMEVSSFDELTLSKLLRHFKITG